MTTASKTSSPILWIASIAIILFSAVGIAAFMGWLPTAYGEQNADSTSEVAAHTDRPVTNKSICADCGVIVSTQLINNVKNTSGIGLVSGAVVGGLLGSKVGGGRGKDLATVAGAVGGAVAGNEIEKSSSATQHYEITVRFDNGSSRVFNQVNQPTWQSGDRVRVIDGVVRSNG
ncbi:MAG: glycine zipper 2TM domain-containing protein [Cycloclasticus sp.]|nr:glycine zipper 2TM domain-containing protein [Cycloclasticus sp.]MBQ0789169.1 glycine zipper 2TM domain-containing protein [Cycloclasticus sp.]